MKRRILESKKSEIAKAGRLVFDAIFGDTKDFERNIEQLEQADTDPGAPPAIAAAPFDDAITVEGYSCVTCGACGREQRLPPNVDVSAVERYGWRCANASWRCPFCVAAGR